MEPNRQPPPPQQQYQPAYQATLSISASAAAAAAAAVNYHNQYPEKSNPNYLSPQQQQQHHPQFHQPQQHPYPRAASAGLPMDPTLYQHQQQQYPPPAPASLHMESSMYQHHPYPQATAPASLQMDPTLAYQQQYPQATPTGLQMDPALYQQYVKQYYLEYYRRYQQHFQQANQVPVRTKTPLKYGYRLVHARAAFSTNDNRLLVVEPNARVAIFSLQEIFTERIYPHLFLHTLLQVNDEKSNAKSSQKTPLPFADSKVTQDWMRVKLLNDFNMNYELKLIFKVITMLFRQNGHVSSLDLSELLYEIVSGGGGGNNANNNEIADSVTDRLSTTGSEMVPHNGEWLLGQLRQQLMRGQRRVAHSFALNNGLFDHAIALAYLTSFQSPNGVHSSADSGLVILSIRKFITTKLEPTDPLFVFYSHLLQIAINSLNSSSSNSLAANPMASAKIESLDSFIILLANDIKFDKVEITNNSLRNLIDLMMALLKDDLDYVLPDELFNDRFDCLLVNECLEFARFRGERVNTRLLLRKLEFAFELFDYGFTQPALNYCEIIRGKLAEDGLELKQLQENTTQLKTSRFAQFLLPLNLLPGESEEADRQFVVNLWLFQIAKMLTRFDASMKFDAPLISLPKEVVTDEGDVEEGNKDVIEEEDSQVVDEEDEVSKEVTGDEDSQEVEEEVEEIAEEPPTAAMQELSIRKEPPPKPTLPKQHILTEKSIPYPRRQISIDDANDDSNFNFKNQNQNQNSAAAVPPPAPPVAPVGANSSFGASMGPEMGQPVNTLLQQRQNYNQPQPEMQKAPLQPPQAQHNANQMDNHLSQTQHRNMMGLHQRQQQQQAPPPPPPQPQRQQSQPELTPSNSMSFFQPPPMPTYDGSAPFDFMSSGQVTNIPTFDPFPLDDHDSGSQPNHQNRTNSNDFQHQHQQQNLQPQQNHLENSKQEPGKDSDSAKNSPSRNGGLLSSIFGMIRPKNQAILPDDKDPTIVYDPVQKRWVDKNAADGGNDAGPPPPPKIPLAGGLHSEPNSTLTSPVNHNSFTSSPSFPSFESFSMGAAPQTSSPFPASGPIANGAIPSPSPSPAPSLSSGLPSKLPPANPNQFRGAIRGRGRYIDVFNATKK